MRRNIMSLIMVLSSVALTACAAIEMREPGSVVDAKPTAPASVEDQALPAQPASEQPTPARPVATLRPPIERAGEIGEAGERVTGEAPQALLDAVLSDAASRTGLDRSELVVVQDQAVVWSDGSLGCPQPGMMYTMALVDGYHIIIQAGDQELDYRTGRNNFFTLCEKFAPPKPVESPSS